MPEIEKNKVAIVGAGVAGITVAATLKQSGIDVDLFEREEKPGGHLKEWHALFPGREHAPEILKGFTDNLKSHDLKIFTSTEVNSVVKERNHFLLTSNRGEIKKYQAVVLANGFRLFDASRKEEYGYGIYPYVITSPELEKLLENPENGLLIGGKPPQKVAFVHCVGSRDAKVGNHYCSRICCITGVKQAISVKELYPDCEVINFYMDLRMFGSGYEELYQEAQEKYGITFIRGRVSEAASTFTGSIQVKAEDTLLGNPLKVTVDWLILLVGMEPGHSTENFAASLGTETDDSGFFKGRNRFLQPGVTVPEGVFIAGACAGPASIPETVNQGRATAVSVIEYLSGKS
jgi:heterodisulfide reductase subunit A2